MLRRSCPALHELLALDAIARHGSLQQAARALCVTPGAVSKQLAHLESFMGHRLVQRSGRTLALTPAGRQYWQATSEPLQRLVDATFAARSGSDGRVLTLACVPTFLTKCLIPRLPALRSACPTLTLAFCHHLAPETNVFPPGVDLAIRYGSGQWPDMQAEYIGGREFVAVCQPELRPAHARGLEQQVLLHHHETPDAWTQWARAHHLPALNSLAGPRFVQYSAIIQGALSGLGVALVPRILVADELAAGSLVIAAGGAIDVDHCHYLCYPDGAPERPAVQAFRRWLLTAG